MLNSHELASAPSTTKPANEASSEIRLRNFVHNLQNKKTQVNSKVHVKSTEELDGVSADVLLLY
jgi:hypothetical protein